MRPVLRIALDLLLEARRRRWFIGMFVAISLVLLTLGLSLQLEVIDGALAGSRLFGKVLFPDLVSAGRVLAGLYTTVAYVAFYGGGLFLAVACSDFGPELLAPGRIEHLLSLPVARWQLLLGTYLGVLVLAAAGIAYGTLGLTVLMGFKMGSWSLTLFLGSMVGLVGFAALYAAMLTTALFVRSAAISGLVGAGVLWLGVLASHRESLAVAIEAGTSRAVFATLMYPLPRLGSLATVSAQLAAMEPVEAALVSRLVVGCLLFSAALLAVAAWRFDRMDF